MELLQVVLAHLLANVTTTIFFSVAYLNFVLFKDYVWTLLWSFVISQALYASKTRLLRAMKALSREEDTRPMLWVLWEVITKPFWWMHKQGTPMHGIVFGSTLNWCIELFALVGLVSLTSRLLSVKLMLATALAMLPLLGILYVLDRRVFAYRRVISDDALASMVVICTFFTSVCYIVLFLGLESVFEGMSAGQSVSSWVQAMLDDGANQSEWSKTIARVTEFAQETTVGFEARYNETVWFPVARNALSHYMEHGTLMPNAVDDTYTDEATEGAVGAFLGAGGISGLVATIRDHMSGLNISMEHVVNYGGPSGKVIANGVTLLASFGSFLVLVGFKVVLFFTCVLYMTSHDDFLQRAVGDFLPIAKEDQQRAMTLLRGAIQGVFFLPCKVACLHGVVTLFSFTVLQVEFPFFAAFVAVLVSVLPIVPAYVVCWPWALTLVLHGRWVGIILAISQYLVFSVVDTELCTQGVREANPYLTGLSSFLGFAVFGAQGVLLGPLIICLATLIYGGLGFLGSSMSQEYEHLSPVVEANDMDDLPTGQPNHRARLHTPQASPPPATPWGKSTLFSPQTGRTRETLSSRGEEDTGGPNPRASSPSSTPNHGFSGNVIDSRASTSPSFARGGGGGGQGQMQRGTRTRRSASFGAPSGRTGLEHAGEEVSDPFAETHSGAPPLQLAELWSTFVSNLQHTRRPRHGAEVDGSRLSRRQSDSSLNPPVCGRLSPGSGNIYDAPTIAQSRKIRVVLQLKERQPVSTEEQSGNGGDAKDEHLQAPPASSAGNLWRLHVSSSLSWEKFILEAQDVMSISGISGVYGRDGARVRRVSFIEDGETLDVIAGTPSG